MRSVSQDEYQEVINQYTDKYRLNGPLDEIRNRILEYDIVKQDLVHELRNIRSSIVETRAVSNKLKVSLDNAINVCSSAKLQDQIYEIGMGIRNASAQLLLLKRSARRDLEKLNLLKQQKRELANQVSILESESHRGALHNSAGTLFFPVELDSVGPQDADSMLMLAMRRRHGPSPKSGPALSSLIELSSECQTARCRPGMLNLVYVLHSTLTKWIKRQSLLSTFSVPITETESKLINQFVLFLKLIQVRTVKNAYSRLAGDMTASMRVSKFDRALKELGFTGDILMLIALFDKTNTGTITYSNFSKYIRPFIYSQT